MKTGITDETVTESKPITFFDMLWGMLPQTAHQRLVKNIADRCCKECGLPAGCTCAEEVLTTTKWTQWPNMAIEFIASLVSKLLRRFKRLQARKLARLAAV